MVKLSHKDIKKFRKEILDWFGKNKRDLPWRRTRDPYKILVSEIMLQQTQVARVLQKYEEWFAKFPTLEVLAKAKPADVLKTWSGLGYNRRALYLKKTAEIMVEEYKGRVSKNVSDLEKLPGIGKNTAGAIIAFSFNMPTIFIETNIRRVFIHCFFKDSGNVADKDIMVLIEQTLDVKNPRDWYYALMDYGSFLAKKTEKPDRKSRHYHKQSKFKNSNRYYRGQIVKILLEEKAVLISDFARRLNIAKPKIKEILISLKKDGFITMHSENVTLT